MPKFDTPRFSAGARGTRWFTDVPHVDKTNYVHVRGHAGLVPMGDTDGAVLIWHFDDSHDDFPVLYTRLTEEEANAVHSADPYTVGLLEPVRRHLRRPWAVLVVMSTDGTVTIAEPFRIPAAVDEDQFLATLDAASHRVPVVLPDRQWQQFGDSTRGLITLV